MSENEAKIELDSLLCFAIYACSREITRIYRPVLAKFGLTYPQYLVMVVLWENGNCTVTELGDKLLLDSATLTPLLKRLEEADLVIRERSSEDERKVEISLTTKGQSLEVELHKVPRSIFTEICKSETNYLNMLEQFQDLLENVHEIARRS